MEMKGTASMSSEALVLIESHDQRTRLRMRIPISTERPDWYDSEEYDPSLKTPERTLLVAHFDILTPFCTAHFRLGMNLLEWDTLEQELRELHQTLTGRVDFRLRDSPPTTRLRLRVSINKLGHLLWQLDFSIAQEVNKSFQIDKVDLEAVLRFQIINDQTYVPPILTQMRHVSTLIANPPYLS